MKTWFLTVYLALAAATLGAAINAPYEAAAWQTPATQLDAIVAQSLRAIGADFTRPSSDATFARRVYLDLTGTLPQPEEIDAFLDNDAPDKRAQLIDQLLESENHVDFATLKWCDLLRVKSEYPVNLWPNGVQAYHRWIRDAVKTKLPYDQFARQLLTASGSNFRVPAANFYRATPTHAPADLAANVSLTFLGRRFESWTPDEQAQLAALFQGLAFKKTSEWKEEIVYWDTTSTAPLSYTFPDGSTLKTTADHDARNDLAAWVIASPHTQFNEVAVNRVWFWLTGYGIVDEPDDFRPDNPPANPELLSYLAQELKAANYDLKHIYRLILNSRVYQQSCFPNPNNQGSSPFASYKTRRIEAESLIDAINQITGGKDHYSSPIPEPFTFIPENARAIEIADGSITSASLNLFGRPSRDQGLQSERSELPTDAQRLYLLNSNEIHQKLNDSFNTLHKPIVRTARDNPNRAIATLYLTILSRYPTPDEIDSVKEHAATLPNPKRQLVDLAWALLNTKEFLYKH